MGGREQAPAPAKVPEVKTEAPPAPAPPKPGPAADARPGAPAQPAPAAAGRRMTPSTGRDVPLPGLSDPVGGDVYEIIAQAAIVRLNYLKSDSDMPVRRSA